VAYQQESAVSIHHRRRRRRAAITLTVVSALLLATFGYAASFIQGWVSPTTPKTLAIATCHSTTTVQPVTPSMVTINVYNATNRNGLAASVAKSLQGQGFKIASVANDPLGMSIQGVGEVRSGPAGAAGASLVATRLSGATVVPDGRTDATVDIVLGEKFTALSAPPKAAPPKTAKTTPSC
jgi:LytR cell envelope-related transcriptional attenuator